MWVRFGKDERRNERALPTLGQSEGSAVREDDVPPAGDTKPEPSECGSGLERRRKGAGEECPRLGVPNKADFTPTTFHVKHPAPSPPLFCKPCYAPIGNHLK